MGVGHTHQVHHALHRPILARHAVERVEDDIGCGLRDARGDLAIHVDPGDAVPALFQRLGDAFARHQRDGAFVRPAAHKDGDVEFAIEGHGLPTRRISHSSSTPEFL